MVLGFYLRLGEDEAVVGLDDIGCGLVEVAYVSAVSELVLLHVAHVSIRLALWSFLLLLVATENAHCLHIHTADSSQESLLEILLDQMLASLIFLVLLRCLCKLLSQHLHFLLISTHYLVHFDLHLVLVCLILMLSFCLSENVSPAIQGLYL